MIDFAKFFPGLGDAMDKASGTLAGLGTQGATLLNQILNAVSPPMTYSVRTGTTTASYGDNIVDSAVISKQVDITVFDANNILIQFGEDPSNQGSWGDAIELSGAAVTSLTLRTKRAQLASKPSGNASRFQLVFWT